MNCHRRKCWAPVEVGDGRGLGGIVQGRNASGAVGGSNDLVRKAGVEVDGG